MSCYFKDQTNIDDNNLSSKKIESVVLHSDENSMCSSTKNDSFQPSIAEVHTITDKI